MGTLSGRPPPVGRRLQPHPGGASVTPVGFCHSLRLRACQTLHNQASHLVCVLTCAVCSIAASLVTAVLTDVMDPPCRDTSRAGRRGAAAGGMWSDCPGPHRAWQQQQASPAACRSARAPVHPLPEPGSPAPPVDRGQRCPAWYVNTHCECAHPSINQFDCAATRTTPRAATEPDASTVPGTEEWLAAADFLGPVKILQYRGIGQPRAYWDRAFAALYRGRLYAFNTRGSTQVLAVHQVWNQQRTLRVPSESAHGHPHVLAVAGAEARAADGLKALYHGGALVFRTVTEAQVHSCVGVWEAE